MIIYMKCACTSSDKAMVQRLRKEGHEVRLLNSNPNWRKEASLYKLKLPFVVEDESHKTGYEFYE